MLFFSPSGPLIPLQLQVLRFFYRCNQRGWFILVMEQIMLPSQDLTNISYYESPTSSSSVVIHYANTLTNKNINRLELSPRILPLCSWKTGIGNFSSSILAADNLRSKRGIFCLSLFSGDERRGKNEVFASWVHFRTQGKENYFSYAEQYACYYDVSYSQPYRPSRKPLLLLYIKKNITEHRGSPDIADL